jgi:hypothetical protein
LAAAIGYSMSITTRGPVAARTECRYKCLYKAPRKQNKVPSTLQQYPHQADLLGAVCIAQSLSLHTCRVEPNSYTTRRICTTPTRNPTKQQAAPPLRPTRKFGAQPLLASKLLGQSVTHRARCRPTNATCHIAAAAEDWAAPLLSLLHTAAH